MIFPSRQSSLSLHRILLLKSRSTLQHWRQVSTTSAINRSLRGSRDSGYIQRGGRDHGLSGLDPSPGASGRDRPRSFVRSDGPRRPRDENGDASFKRNSPPSEYASRGRRDDYTTPDRSVRARGKDGYRGQPGFAARSSRDEDDIPSYQRKDSSDGQSERRRPLGFEPQSRFDASGDGTSGRGTGRREFAGRSRRDFDAGRQEIPKRRGRGFGDGERSFGGRRDRDSGPERSDFTGHREGKFEQRPKGFAGRRDREPVEGRREAASPRFRSTESSYRKEAVPSSGSERAVNTPAVQTAEENAGARIGLLRDIKTACKLIRSIQKSEASGGDTSELINMTIASLRSVNKHVTSGKFKDEPSEAIASLFEKKAFAGTFIDIADAASSNASVLFQRGDGKIELAAKRRDSATPDSRRTATKSDSRKEYEERSPEVTREGRADPRAKEPRSSRNSESREEDGNDGIPVSIPYTTAASEFVYGKNAVFAALKAQRRKLYNLYVHPNIIEREASGNTGRSAKSRYAKPEHEFTTLAKNANVPFRNEYKAFLLDKMSDGRPHNGVVLEASKLPAPPILALGKPDIRKSAIPLVTGPQSAEELAVNGGAGSISVSTNSWRHPFVVLLDGILDPANVGNIMRTCHFYGADAVAVATNTCAPLASGVLAKASSGACEAVQILSLPQPSNFVHDSAKAGWKIYAAVAPEAGPPSRDAKRQLTTAAVAAASPLANHPCILMLGAEGEGLRENLKNRADAFVSIERGPNNAPDVGVDSMNVGVAAGVLMEAFLRKPADAPEKIDTTSELGF